MRLCVLLTALLALATARRVPTWHLKMVQKQGPNTCAVEELPGRGRSIWTECKYWMHREVCGVKTVLRYDCCEGFQRVTDRPGCGGVKPMKNVLDTARDLGATRFVEMFIKAGLAEKLRHPGSAVTLFAPTNSAFEVPGIHPELLYHVIGRKLTSRDFGANNDVETLHQGRKVRLNSYSSGVRTVNCVPVLRKDQHATDGIVHLVGGVLPLRGDATVAEAIIEDGRFRDLAELMLNSGLASELRGPGPFTVFTPSDEAFQNIRPSELRRITADKGALRALARHHVVRSAACPSAVINSHRLHTLAGTELELTCNTSGTFVDGAQLLDDILIAGNGVVNVVSDVLLPDRVRTVLELADRRKDTLSTFLKLVRAAEVEDELSAPDINVTVFAPSNKAFEELTPSRLEELTSDLDGARQLLRHHMVDGKLFGNMASDNQLVATLDGRSSVRLKVYRQAVGVESAIVTEPDVEGQNGVLHIIDKVLLPTNSSLLQLLRDNGDFRVFAEAVDHIKALDPTFLNSNDSSQSFTVFAPSNEAFDRLGSDRLRALMQDSKRLRRVVLNHVTDSMMATGAFRPNLLYNVQTAVDTLRLVKEDKEVTVNGANVIHPDVLAKNGIVHCIDQVLLPASDGDDL